MMKNLDKIRAMSAKELAENLEKKACYWCINYNLNHDKCRLGLIRPPECCRHGIVEWLYQEVNPMPVLKVGYIISSYYPTTKNTVNYVYLGNSVLWCDKDESFVKFENNMKKFIKAIYRKDIDDFTKVELWRADNDE